MNDIRTMLPRVALVLLALSLPVMATAQRAQKLDEKQEKQAEAQQAEAAAIAALGSQVPPANAIGLATILRSGDRSVFAALSKSSGDAFEASGIDVDFVTVKFGPLKIQNAHVSLTPSADGRSCRFAITGTPFGEGSTLEASGTAEWGVGPLGGDKLDLVYAVGNAPVEAVRTFLPGRIDPSFRGMVGFHGKASGIINETTTEDAPATPLRGDFEAMLDWQILGRTAPATINGNFSLDDKMVRISGGHIKWQDFDLALRGWFEPFPTGKIELTALFNDIDAHKVAVDWNVPPPWQPTATLTGQFNLTGKQGQSMLKYEARAPSADVPGLGGYNVHMVKPKFTGSILVINADASVTFLPEQWSVGGIDLGSLPSGILWFRDKVMYNASNSPLWGGENDATISYKPAEHPAFTMSGRIKGADGRIMAQRLLPQLGLDAEGYGSVSYIFGQDVERKPQWSVHGSLLTGRIGNVDLFARTLDALGAADPSIKVADAAADMPKPRHGTGTRIDKFFFEAEKNADAYSLGGMFLRAEEFQLDADGEYSEASGLNLDGTVMFPPAAVDKLAASAPWIKALRVEGGPMYVPVAITGKTQSPAVALAPGYAELLASTKRGEPVTAPGIKHARKVGAENVASIPGDPNAINE